jgi:drug/metabolite transporter (DMT)-like permease
MRPAPADETASAPLLSGAVHRPLAAALWMSGCIAGFTGIAVAAREIGPALDTYEMMLYRSVVGVFVVLVLAAAFRNLGQISTRKLPAQLARNLVHFAAQNLWLYAIALIPLAQVFALEFTTPLIVALAAPLVLGERLTRIRLATALIGFAGILIVARPLGGGGWSPGLIAALASAFGFAAAALVTKRLTRDLTVTNILFWLTLMQTLIGLVCAGWDGTIALPPPASYPFVALLGLSGLLAHFSLTKALSLAPATFVMPFDFLRLPLIAVVGMAFYAEALDVWVLVGGAVIFAANWVNVAAETRSRKEMARPEAERHVIN